VWDFWGYTTRTRLFSKYGVHGGALFSYVFQSFRHEFSDYGKRRMKTLQRELPDEPERMLTPPSPGLSPEEMAMARETVGRVDACLALLGMEVGQDGWLLLQMDVMGKRSAELVTLCGLREGTLRTRATRARARFKTLWGAEGGDVAAARPAERDRLKARPDVNDDDAARLLRTLDITAPHPSDEELVGWAYGDLREADHRRVDAHLSTCSECHEQGSRVRRAATHFETAIGKAQLGRLWTSFREAAQQFHADATSDRTSGFAAAASHVHERYMQSATRDERVPASLSELDDDRTVSNYHQLAYAEHLLKTEGLGVRPITDPARQLLVLEDVVGPDGLRRLAEKEHERFVAERVLQGWRRGAIKDAANKISPYLVPWKHLAPEIQELDVNAVRALPAALSAIGREVFRVEGDVDRPPSDRKR